MTLGLAPVQSQRGAQLVGIGAVSLWFAASSVLCIYSDARVAMTVGDRYPALWEQIPLWSSLILQPWIILALIIESQSGIYFLSTSLTGAVLASALSGGLMFWILSRAVGRFRVAGWLALGLLAILAAFDTHSFVSDMRVVPAAVSDPGP